MGAAPRLTRSCVQPTGTSALMMACSVGNVEAARALLMFGATLDLEDVRGGSCGDLLAPVREN